MEKSKKFLQLCKKYKVDPANLPNEVLSFEDACKITGDNPKKLPLVTGIAERHRKRIIADYKLSIIAEAIKNNVPVDYTNGKYKHFPVFYVNADKKRPSGFGLAYYGADLWHSHSVVGVRLCFPNPDMAIFFGKHFIDLHKDHHLYT